MPVFGAKKSSPSRSTGSTTRLQRSERAAPTMSTASRSLRIKGPVGSQLRMRMPHNVSLVSAMASPGATQEVGDCIGRGRNEMADFGVEMNLGLRQQLFSAAIRFIGIDHRILAAEENGDRHLQLLQFLIALRRNGIAARIEVAKDEAEEIRDRLGGR